MNRFLALWLFPFFNTMHLYLISDSESSQASSLQHQSPPGPPPAVPFPPAGHPAMMHPAHPMSPPSQPMSPAVSQSAIGCPPPMVRGLHHVPPGRSTGVIHNENLWLMRTCTVTSPLGILITVFIIRILSVALHVLFCHKVCTYM